MANSIEASSSYIRTIMGNRRTVEQVLLGFDTANQDLTVITAGNAQHWYLVGMFGASNVATDYVFKSGSTSFTISLGEYSGPLSEGLSDSLILKAVNAGDNLAMRVSSVPAGGKIQLVLHYFIAGEDLT